MMKNCRTTHTIALVLLVIMVLPPPMARAQTAARSENAVGASGSNEQLHLLVGRSVVIRTDRPITRVSLSTPDIADALVTTPYELLVHGKAPGTISLLVWSDNGRITTYDVSVRRDLSALDDQMHKLFPKEAIGVASNGKDVVLSGIVSTKYIVDKASMLAVGYVDKPENVVNLMQQQEGVVTDQILLRVRFAEVSRTAVQQLGASFFTGANGKGNYIARSTTQQFAAPTFDSSGGATSKLVFSDFLNLFAFNTEEQLGALVQAMKQKGLFQSLAEPNLVTTDGKEASFLAGGEYPYPVVQGGGGANVAVTIVFKEFGVRLKFTPTVLAGGMIHLKVMPEVSTLDFGNAVVLQGFRVPALTTRRTETEVELRDGQTFAVAGLLDHTVNETLRKVPGIGDIPILGYLFKSQAYNKDSTELVVMITPHILRRDSPGVTPTLPGMDQPYLEMPKRTIPQPPAAFTQPQAQQQAQPKSVVEAPVVEAPPAVPVAVQKSVPAPVAAVKPAASAAGQRQVAEKAAKDQQKQLEVQRAQADLQRKQDELQRKQDEARARASATINAAAAKVEAANAEQQRKQDAARAVADAATAKADAALAEQQSRKDAEAAREELKKLNLAQKDAEKRAAEQGVIDRKRMIEQQAEAARVKEAADKLAKEKAKLDKEQSDREAELARLIAQYQKLTGTQETAAR